MHMQATNVKLAIHVFFVAYFLYSLFCLALKI